MAVDGHQPRVGLHEWIVARPCGERAFSAERGDRAVHEPRIEPRGSREVETELLDDARTQALDENIRALDEPLENVDAPFALEVDGEAPLVSIQRHEDGALAGPERWTPSPRIVPPSRALDLDDLGTHVTERLRAEWAGHVLGEVGDDDSIERKRHGRSLAAEVVPGERLHTARGPLRSRVVRRARRRRSQPAQRASRRR
jgi:hypothetical protein